ncbi:vesicle-associated membrane protein-associated protein B-like [Cimex lectularius]|uniref:MSP domain-containing protein n=1 Tax=Cimex lectularius TaxID=79782 RepID=A0A8I6RBN7_CIMLE|nr:vesicle-associated membrane protein-associated protein B-like [Cimex lectularius]XP_014240855.1 vesicle-associated membrane protein-associated protein B-like [Cimex lectularius]
MAKPEQVLNITPQSELKFQGPFTKMVSAFITLHNPTNKSVLFKIKTTAPKKYCVRPNSGELLPDERTTIHVCLQPFDYDPNEKCKHKFMVQSLFTPPDTHPVLAWNEVKPEKLMDTKLRCVFEYPVESNDTTNSSPSPVPASNVPAAQKEERKFIGDSPNNADTELNEVTKEVEQLREEEIILRKENIKLKELIMQLDRKLNMQDMRSSRSLSQASPISQQTPLIVMAILSGLLGIILGKFLL